MDSGAQNMVAIQTEERGTAKITKCQIWSDTVSISPQYSIAALRKAHADSLPFIKSPYGSPQHSMDVCVIEHRLS